jgi:hypothetical protein
MRCLDSDKRRCVGQFSTISVAWYIVWTLDGIVQPLADAVEHVALWDGRVQPGYGGVTGVQRKSVVYSARCVSDPDRFRESSTPWTRSASTFMIHVHVTGSSLMQRHHSYIDLDSRHLFLFPASLGPGDRRVLAAETNGLDTCQDSC